MICITGLTWPTNRWEPAAHWNRIAPVSAADDGDADRPIEVRAKAGTTGMEKRETKGCYALACVFVELGELDGGQPNGAGRGGAPGCGVV